MAVNKQDSLTSLSVFSFLSLSLMNVHSNLSVLYDTFYIHTGRLNPVDIPETHSTTTKNLQFVAPLCPEVT